MTPAAALALNFSRALVSSSRSANCTRRSSDSYDRLLQTVGGEPRHVQRRQSLLVEPLLDAGNAAVVDVDQADDLRDGGAVRVDALVLVEEADARDAEMADFVLLLRRDLALEPDEAALGGEPLAQFLGVQIGQRGGEPLDGVVDVDQLARLGKQRGRLHVGSDNRVVAVEDVGPRGGKRVLRDGVAVGMIVAGGGEHREPERDHAIDAGEGEHREAKPRSGLDVAVDAAAVEQRAQQALPAGFACAATRRSPRRRRHAAGRLRIAEHGADRIGPAPAVQSAAAARAERLKSPNWAALTG